MRSIFLILLALSSPALAGNCHIFMPEKSTVQGALSQETFPGAPNYKSIEDGDKPEIHYFLSLEPSICIDPKEGSKAHKPVSSVSKIQLTFRGETEAMHRKLEPHAGAEVKCAGYFFSSHRPHHHTQILMMTRDCEPVAAESPASP